MRRSENIGCLGILLAHLFFRPLFWIFRHPIRAYTALIFVGTTTLFSSLVGHVGIAVIVGVIASICYYYFAREKEKEKAAETLEAIGTMTDIPQADIVPDKARRYILLYNQILMVPQGQGSKSRLEPVEITVHDIQYKAEILKGNYYFEVYRDVRTDEGEERQWKTVTINCVYNFSERAWTISSKHIGRFLKYHSL